MELADIYQPIATELKSVEEFLAASLRESKHPSILSLGDFVLESPGKRLRPALAILSEKAASAGETDGANRDDLIRVATAVELIHLTALIHDDVLDHAKMRRGKPSVNAKWGDDVSIALGDYVYSKAFELVGRCRSPGLFSCISEAMYAMCEGELSQVCQRGDLELTRESYLLIISKKTARPFAACCHAGTIIGNHSPNIQEALRRFGWNFGIAFQIIDDCRDLISEEKTLGKRPGQDVLAGDITLPILTLLDVAGPSDRQHVKNLLRLDTNGDSLRTIRDMFINSPALDITVSTASSYVDQAKQCLRGLGSSDYRDSLTYLADYVTDGIL